MISPGRLINHSISSKIIIINRPVKNTDSDVSNIIVVIVEIDIPGPPLVSLHEFGVIRGTLVLGVGGQHAL